MSDLISRQALLEALQKDREAVCSHVFCHTDCQHEEELALDLEQFIRNQPTIEAVQVIHCKDCTQWGCGLPMETDSIKCCGFGGYMVGKQGYCVYGQKKP